MNRLIKLLCLILCNGLASTAVDDANLSALSSGPYVQQLYETLKNEDAPTERDKAVGQPSIRFNICKCVTDSGFFGLLQYRRISQKELVEHWDDSRYSRLFQEIYRANSQDVYYYWNDYNYKLLRVAQNTSLHISEHVFICPLENTNNGDVLPLYVSKEYDVGSFRELYKPGRFLFIPPGYQPILAEVPAEAIIRERAEVEFHYLRIRKHIEPVLDHDIDPLCKLISSERSDPRNQHYRLCVAVYRSAYFTDEVDYSRHVPYACSRKAVSFRTTEVVKQYYENTALCFATYRGSRQAGRVGSFIYISRAYKSNQVFVYRRDPADQRIYLENLSFNISIVDELHSFDFIED